MAEGENHGARRADGDRAGHPGGSGFGHRIRSQVREHITGLTSASDTEHKAGAKKHVLSRLDQMAKQQQRQSGLLMSTAIGLLRDNFKQHIDRLGHDQRMFQLTARVQRGDVNGMTHQELRDVRDYPEKYGGPHAAQIFQNAHSELHRREGVRQFEKRNIRHSNMNEDAAIRRGHNDLAHQQRIIHGAHESAADRRNRTLKEQQRSEFHARRNEAKWEQQSRQRPTGVGAAANRVAPNHNGPVPAPGQHPGTAPPTRGAPRPTAQVFHGKKAGTVYTKDARGNKHYITHKVAPRGGRPAPRMPRR